jgi:TorA maturation chaperone TorD
MENKNINLARSVYYEMLSLFFVESFVKDTKDLVQKLQLLIDNTFEEDVRVSLESIKTKLESGEDLYREFEYLFLLPFGSGVSLSSSYYYEEREAGAMLLVMREELAKTTVRKDDSLFTNPEDDFGFVFSFMSHLAKEEIERVDFTDSSQVVILQKVIKPHYKKLVENIKNSDSNIYKDVAIVLDSFIDFDCYYLGV